MPPLSLTPEVEEMLRSGSPVATGVSGGKDSSAVALAVSEYLDSIKHTGKRILIHSDLGLVEWKDSGPTCERLAQRLGLELVTVRRKAGGMMERWEGRWRNNVARYANLECVKLILPWSTAALRFCTSELKVDCISADLKKRFPNSRILSVSGIRRQESPKRKKAPILTEQVKMRSKKYNTTGFNWNAILDWKEDEVYSFLEEKKFLLHEGYKTFGSSRISCVFCILGSQKDLKASSTCSDNHVAYRRMVDLEILSTFSFQNTWLGDVAPHLLSPEQTIGLLKAKEASRVRQKAEASIPKHLLYTKGWPTVMPTYGEARLLSSIRKTVADVVGLEIKFTEPDEIIERYRELMAEKARKDR